ncbi:MAG: hypothetical protein OXI48_03040 [bacterium]|nr:hypothetical protein [bacterium]
MNAAELLERLVSYGIAREVPATSGVSRAVTVNRIEVAIAVDGRERSLRARWRERAENRGLAYLLVVDDPKHLGSVRTLGPRTYNEPVRSVDCAGLAAVIEATAEMTALGAVRHLAGEVVRLAGRGLVTSGLLTRHSLEDRFGNDESRWQAAREAVSSLPIKGDWRSVFMGLGYEVERLPQRGWLARRDGQPVAVVHPWANPEDFVRLDEIGRPAEGVLAGDCRKQGVRYGVMTCRSRYRLFDCDPSATTAEWLDLDTALLGEDRRAYLALLAPAYLADGGLGELQAEARSFGARLHRRLDETIRTEALPALAAGLGRWASRNDVDVRDDAQRAELERASLTLLFRLLFTLYAESSRFLPVDNETYRRRSLSTLIEEAHTTRHKLSEESTALWSNFATLVRALRFGNPAWGVPAYNGALFSADDFEGAALLERLELGDPDFARVLLAVGRDETEGSGVDYSSLEIGHLGHIYGVLLSMRLSVADRPLRYDASTDRYVPAAIEKPSSGGSSARTSTDQATLEVAEGSLLWQTNEGGRKAGGVYYTPVSLVRHLVNLAVVPAYERHLEGVRETAETDPARAAVELLDFAVLDPACGSAHFLVQVTETLADRAVAFLGQTPLPAIRGALDRLRAQARGGAAVTDVALLRRLVLKHCVFGVDLSPMGAEIATMSLWLASFVPGLSLAYLGRNVVVGNSLIGVGSAGSVVREGTWPAEALRKALSEASEAAARLAEIEDTTPREVEASRAADAEAWEATAGLARLFDLWTAEGFGLTGARGLAETDGPAVIAGTNGVNGDKLAEQATRLAGEHRFLHWPLAFPRVFTRERPGFDAVVGNPPWEEVTVERLGFFLLHRPGLQGLPQAERDDAIAELGVTRPELALAFAAEQARVSAWREAVAGGEYEPTAGDPDLYKYFCQRYRFLVRDGGAIGVVLPRSAFVAQGSEGFREWLYTRTSAERVDFLVNSGKWMFDSEPRYGVALVVSRNVLPAAGHRVGIAGPADSPEAWRAQSSASGVTAASASFPSGWLTPKLRSADEADLLAKFRIGSRFPIGSSEAWTCFPVGELHETNDKRLWVGASEGRPLWKGESFDQFDPRGAEQRRCPVSDKVRKKLHKPRPGAKSLLATRVNSAERRQAVLKELRRARLAFRDVSRSDDSRTVRACLVPPDVLLTNKAPYLAFVGGDERAQAACLGVMNSLPFDWQARRFVETNLNFFILEALTVPDLDEDAFASVARSAARLSAVDDRFADFAAATGTECGPLRDDERQRLRVEIDAWVAHAWELTDADLAVMCDDFTTDAVPSVYREALVTRLNELR